LAPEIADFARTLANEPFRAREDLRTDVRGYMHKLERMADSVEFLDLDTARRLAVQCEALLSGAAEDLNQEVHVLIQVAVRYFVEDKDGEADTTSLVGFDDDAEVIAAIAKALGREDILELGKEDD